MQKPQLINNMIFFLASLPLAAYTALQEVYRKYEEAKRLPSTPSQTAEDQELKNLDNTTVQTMQKQVATGDLMLRELNQVQVIKEYGEVKGGI